MDLSQLVLFSIASLALIAAPGPDMIYVLSRGMAGGKKTGLFSAGGVTAGILIHTFLAAAGLAALFKTSDVVFLIVKYAGAAYLIFLGVKNLLTYGKASADVAEAGKKHTAAFWQGIVTNVLNPKVALFILAFLPQFIDRAEASPGYQMIILGAAYAALTLLLYGSLGFFTGGIGRWLQKRPGAEKWLHRFSGIVLIGLGLRLALTRQ